MKSIAIIGGGAAGMMAAVTASKTLNGSADITIFERKDRVGKKLLATGNGRCNLTNTNACETYYHGKKPSFVNNALKTLSAQQTIDFFYEMGVVCKTEYGGRVFPYCEQASAVLDVFRNELAHLSVKIVTDAEINEIRQINGGFQLFSVGKPFCCDKVIVACGGKASPALGSNGGGFALLEKLKHTIVNPMPALVQLKTDTKLTKGLQGIKMDCMITAFSQRGKVDQTDGEVLFTNYGLSGSGILDISRVLCQHDKITLSLDMAKDFEQEQLENMLLARKTALSHLTCEQFLIGMINKKVGQMLMKQSGIEKLSLPVSSLTAGQIRKLAHIMKHFEINVHDHNGWENAQVTAGGASTDEFDEKTMESKLVKGLYGAGEVLDIFGDCGGYNLQWAWSSGFIAGKSAAQAVMEGNND